MRLLRCDGTEPMLISYNDSDIPKYAVLSHTWMDAKDEVLFNDLNDLESAKQKPGWLKLDYTCRQAREEGLSHVWIDTCCIDKSSSAELAEAINSMYRWYRLSTVCFVYLADVWITIEDKSLWTQVADAETGWAGFCESRWFTRGWTLQELLAPSSVAFFDATWHTVGTISRDRVPRKANLRLPFAAPGHLPRKIADITGIHEAALLGTSLVSSFSVAQRMYWAASRQTTREEDRAYSLLGLLDVNMPSIHGEGQKAFRRLQLEILRESSDQSILAWRLLPNSAGGQSQSLLAPSPLHFKESGNVIPLAHQPSRVYEVTNNGIRLTLPMSQDEMSTRVVLHCTLTNDRTKSVVLYLTVVQGYRREFFVRDYDRVQYLDVYDTMLNTSERTFEILHQHREDQPASDLSDRIVICRLVVGKKAPDRALSMEAIEPQDFWRSAYHGFTFPHGSSIDASLHLLIDNKPRAKLLLKCSGDQESRAEYKDGIGLAMINSPYQTVADMPDYRVPDGRPLRADVLLGEGLHATAEMFEQFLNDRWMTIVAIRVTPLWLLMRCPGEVKDPVVLARSNLASEATT